jgi:hypothetical protein
MRNKIKLLFELFYLMGVVLVLYLCFNYFAISMIVLTAILLRIFLYIYVTALRLKRNKINITTKKGLKAVNDLNIKINFWNGRS